MISGASPAASVVRALLALLASLYTAGAMGADAGAWDLKRLMGELGQVKSAKAKFVERKQIAILNAPLESSGTLLYVAPARLEKHTLTPRAESLVLDGDRVTLENKAQNQRRTLSLQQYPEIGALVESLRSTLAGDLATLQRYFQVALEGSETQWRLILKPSEPAMQRMVSEIRIDGSRAWVSGIEIVETGGDRSVMTIVRDGP
jgi:outer membrane lipoprotein-sorting protein